MAGRSNESALPSFLYAMERLRTAHEETPKKFAVLDMFPYSGLKKGIVAIEQQDSDFLPEQLKSCLEKLLNLSKIYSKWEAKGYHRCDGNLTKERLLNDRDWTFIHYGDVFYDVVTSSKGLPFITRKQMLNHYLGRSALEEEIFHFWVMELASHLMDSLTFFQKAASLPSTKTQERGLLEKKGMKSLTYFESDYKSVFSI